MIFVVSGLPRSGTSMLMNMLQAGGMKILTDQKRQADKDNPKGYFEYELVKQLPQGKTNCLKKTQGKAVKIISELLKYLPSKYSYKIIFVNRDLDEVLASQAKMMERKGKKDNLDPQIMKQAFKGHLKKVKQWLADQENIDFIEIDYNQTIKTPLETAKKINQFSKQNLAVEKMVSVVDSTLYRQKNI